MGLQPYCCWTKKPWNLCHILWLGFRKMPNMSLNTASFSSDHILCSTCQLLLQDMGYLMEKNKSREVFSSSWTNNGFIFPPFPWSLVKCNAASPLSWKADKQLPLLIDCHWGSIYGRLNGIWGFVLNIIPFSLPLFLSKIYLFFNWDIKPKFGLPQNGTWCLYSSRWFCTATIQTLFFSWPVPIILSTNAP